MAFKPKFLRLLSRASEAAERQARRLQRVPLIPRTPRGLPRQKGIIPKRWDLVCFAGRQLLAAGLRRFHQAVEGRKRPPRMTPQPARRGRRLPQPTTPAGARAGRWRKIHEAQAREQAQQAEVRRVRGIGEQQEAERRRRNLSMPPVAQVVDNRPDWLKRGEPLIERNPYGGGRRAPSAPPSERPGSDADREFKEHLRRVMASKTRLRPAPAAPPPQRRLPEPTTPAGARAAQWKAVLEGQPKEQAEQERLRRERRIAEGQQREAVQLAEIRAKRAEAAPQAPAGAAAERRLPPAAPPPPESAGGGAVRGAAAGRHRRLAGPAGPERRRGGRGAGRRLPAAGRATPRRWEEDDDPQGRRLPGMPGKGGVGDAGAEPPAEQRADLLEATNEVRDTLKDIQAMLKEWLADRKASPDAPAGGSESPAAAAQPEKQAERRGGDSGGGMTEVLELFELFGA